MTVLQQFVWPFLVIFDQIYFWHKLPSVCSRCEHHGQLRAGPASYPLQELAHRGSLWQEIQTGLLWTQRSLHQQWLQGRGMTEQLSHEDCERTQVLLFLLTVPELNLKIETCWLFYDRKHTCVCFLFSVGECYPHSQPRRACKQCHGAAQLY